MEIIRNFSILILFFGIILLTVYLTKSYYIKNDFIKREENIKKDEDVFLPSKQFASMFNDPSVYINPLI